MTTHINIKKTQIEKAWLEKKKKKKRQNGEFCSPID